MKILKLLLMLSFLIYLVGCSEENTDSVVNPSDAQVKSEIPQKVSDFPKAIELNDEMKDIHSKMESPGENFVEAKRKYKDNTPYSTQSEYKYYSLTNNYWGYISARNLNDAYMWGSWYSYGGYNYIYTYQWTSIRLPEGAEYVSSYSWYGRGTLYAYDENGAYIGYSNGWGYGWTWRGIGAPSGRKIKTVSFSGGAYWLHLNVWYPSNVAPVANAGADQTFDCVIGNQAVTLDGSASSDADGDALTYSWSGSFGHASGVNPTVTLGPGTHTINLAVIDPSGASSVDQVIITVNADVTAPVVSAPADITVYANAAGGFSGDIGSASATDECDTNPSLSSDAPSLFTLGTTIVTYSATDASGNTGTATQSVTVERFPLTVDVKPGNAENSVNTKSNGVVPVAVLSDADFDATTLDVSTLTFGDFGATESHGQGHIEDVDGDGDMDLVLHFDTQSLGLVEGSQTLSLIGDTNGGIPVGGSDVVNGKSNGKGGKKP